MQPATALAKFPLPFNPNYLHLYLFLFQEQLILSHLTIDPVISTLGSSAYVSYSEEVLSAFSSLQGV